MGFFEEIDSIVGQDLTGYKVVVMTEVFRVNQEGRKTSVVGYFKSAVIAKGFAEMQTDANWHKTGPAHVLTDGKLAYLLASDERVKLFNDEAEAEHIRRHARAKLSPTERQLLGLSE